MMLLGEKVKAPFRPTSTLVLRSPPTGSPSDGEVLGVDAFPAFSLKASRVFPELGLRIRQNEMMRR